MSRDWQNFFTAEDFAESGNPFRMDYKTADKANAILREELKKAIRVYCQAVYLDTMGWTIEYQQNDTHTALLIDEKQINSKSTTR